MSAYYNEHDPFAAQWLRNLIARGVIAPGDVDERDIRDVRPDDLVGYAQCHFFAGIGVWSFALRLAGWPDDRPVWTGSCPCQPFSAAGKGLGFADERHLWPAWLHLIRHRRPPVVFGEQVASQDGLEWLDLVQDDLEGEGYPFGAADLCAAGVGAPHIRQRLVWMAHTHGGLVRQGRAIRRGGDHGGDALAWPGSGGGGGAGSLADSGCREFQLRRGFQRLERAPSEAQGPCGERQWVRDATCHSRRPCELADPSSAGSLPCAQRDVHRGEESHGSWDAESERYGATGVMGHPGRAGLEVGSVANVGCGDVRDQGPPAAQNGVFGQLGDPQHHRCQGGGEAGQGAGADVPPGQAGVLADSDEPVAGDGALQRIRQLGGAACDPANRPWDDGLPGPVNRFWRGADWLLCRDGKWRAVEPGSFPLADGASARVGRLRAYGNAINPWPTAEFIAAVLDYEEVHA